MPSYFSIYPQRTCDVFSKDFNKLQKLNGYIYVCCALIALSWWVFLVWAIFSHQTTDSFYVGPVVVATFVLWVIDALFFMTIGYCAMKIAFLDFKYVIQNIPKWGSMLFLIVTSFYLNEKAIDASFPFEKHTKGPELIAPSTPKNHEWPSSNK